MAEQCPECGSTESVLTARQAFENGTGRLAPPPAPPEPTQGVQPENANLRLRWLLSGGYIAAVVILVVVGAVSGAGVARSLRWIPFPGLTVILLLFRLRRGGRPQASAQDLAVRVWQRGIWTRQMQVWEHARFCRGCGGAFWPAGVLRPDYPASPLFPLEQFPVMVATMADRAYGTAQPTIHH